MRAKSGKEKIEEHLYALAEGVEQESALWIYLNFLDDLSKGYLAYKPLKGDVVSLEEILDHNALIVIVHEHGGTMATYLHGETGDQAAASEGMLMYLLHTLPGSEEFPEEELSSLLPTGREVVAAITMSRASSEHPAVMLFYLPQFEEATIFAALKGAIKA